MSRLQQSFWTGSETRVPDHGMIVQVGALCLRQAKHRVEVLLVKSSRGRWILPKGWPMEDLCDAHAAKMEAWEEAGVQKGRVSKAPIGGYITEKRIDGWWGLPCHVSVYRIDVKNMVNDYPEAGRRNRKWMSLKKAAKKVDDDGLGMLLKAQG